MARAKVDHSTRTRVVSLLQISVSLVFWIWAIVNTVSGKAKPVDGGVISFLFPMMAGIFGWKSLSGHDPTKKMAKFSMAFTAVGHVLVSLNYVLGIVVAPNDAFMWYCITMTSLWAISGIVFTIWAVQWIKEEDAHYSQFL